MTMDVSPSVKVLDNNQRLQCCYCKYNIGSCLKYQANKVHVIPSNQVLITIKENVFYGACRHCILTLNHEL